MKSEVSIKQIYTAVYIVSLRRELTGGGCGKDFFNPISPGVLDPSNTPRVGQKVPEFDCLNFHDILHHKKTCSPKNVIWVAIDPKSC